MSRYTAYISKNNGKGQSKFLDLKDDGAAIAASEKMLSWANANRVSVYAGWVPKGIILRHKPFHTASLSTSRSAGLAASAAA